MREFAHRTGTSEQGNIEVNPAAFMELPKSIAIAGAWGYIGRKFLDAAIALGIETYVLDPGPRPGDLDKAAGCRIDRPETFYQLPVDFFHLAVHPEDRSRAIELLVSRHDVTSPVILNEKPMSNPENPARCRELVKQTEQTQTCMLFDFPELFDELTARICCFLSSFRQVEIHEIYLQRSKDRESPDIPRNYKRMVPIQYQESVHCLAYALYLLGYLEQSVSSVLDRGLSVRARSELYVPPNPEAYTYPVDGRCEYHLALGNISIRGLTDFKRNAPWSKSRIIRGTADGKDFSLEVDYLEGRKRLAMNGVDQQCDATRDSYQQVIQTAWRWQREISLPGLMRGVFPNPTFAWIAYQLSSVLWRSAQDQRPIALESCAELLAFDAEFTSRRRG